MENGIIKNVAFPAEPHNVVNKNYVDSLLLALKENFNPINIESILSFTITGAYTTSNIAGLYTKTNNPLQVYTKLIDPNFIYAPSSPPTTLSNFIGFPSYFNNLWILGRTFTADENTYYRYYAHAPAISGQPFLMPVSGWVSTLEGYNLAKLGSEGGTLNDYVIQNNFNFQTAFVQSNPLEVADNSISYLKLRKTIGDEAVTTETIKDNAVTGIKIQNGSVTANKIADFTITPNKLASNSVTTSKITAGNITNTHIADNAITTSKITAGNITNALMSDNAITTSKIVDGNVTNVKLGSDIDGSKILSNSIPSSKFQPSSYFFTHTPAVGATPSKVETTADTFKCNNFTSTHITASNNNLSLNNTLNSNDTINAQNGYLLPLLKTKLKPSSTNLTLNESFYHNQDLKVAYAGTDNDGYRTFNIFVNSNASCSFVGSTCILGVGRGFAGTNISVSSQKYAYEVNDGLLFHETIKPIPFNKIINNDIPELNINLATNSFSFTNYQNIFPSSTAPFSSTSKKYLLTCSGSVHSPEVQLGWTAVFSARMPGNVISGTLHQLNEINSTFYSGNTAKSPETFFNCSTIIEIGPNSFSGSLSVDYFLTYVGGVYINTYWGEYQYTTYSTTANNLWYKPHPVSSGRVVTDSAVQLIIQRIK
ncbi:hypothetical protein EBR43_09830 [bacterium]|nr:hypothetical protein [bacterium]